MKTPFLIPTLISINLLLAACGEPAPTATDTVESLAADPQRLETLREQCRNDSSGTDAELCAMVSEATRLRFRGEGTPYTPGGTGQLR